MLLLWRMLLVVDDDDRSAVAVVALVVGIVDVVVVEDAAAGGSPEVETSLWVPGGSWSGLEAEAGGREDSPLSRCSWAPVALNMGHPSQGCWHCLAGSCSELWCQVPQLGGVQHGLAALVNISDNNQG